MYGRQLKVEMFARASESGAGFAAGKVDERFFRLRSSLACVGVALKVGRAGEPQHSFRGLR